MIRNGRTSERGKEVEMDRFDWMHVWGAMLLLFVVVVGGIHMLRGGEP